MPRPNWWYWWFRVANVYALAHQADDVAIGFSLTEWANVQATCNEEILVGGSYVEETISSDISAHRKQSMIHLGSSQR